MKNLQRIKFLIVDDLDANLLALEGLLQRDGLELLKARSGSEALELLLIHEVALALIDVRMPEMNGFELAEIMRGHSRTRHVPIIFLTAGVVDQKKRIQGYETGAVDFLPKPIDPMSLRNKAAVFFDLARQRAELLESEARLLHSNELLEASNAELARTIGGLDRANREKDEFLAMLAHELRNPLAPVRNATEILQLCGTESPQGSGALKLIRHQVDNMSHLINDLLDVSRITQGKIQLKSQDVELAPMMKNAAALIQSACRAAKQELVINLPQYPTFLDADATRIEQCLGNLLSNASKYGGEGCRIEFTADV
ncbi:MAG: hybrid sensor histidine kinase/response regulator, partial [Proteobacteria bacterium]